MISGAEICRLLLNIEGSAPFVGVDGQTLGHLYAGILSSLDLNVLRILKEHSVDIDKKDLEGITVLYRAAISGSLTKDSLEFLCNVVSI